MALAALIVGLDVHMAVLMVSALLWFYGWVTASIQMADWFEYVRRYSPRKSAWLGILFFVIAGPLPIGFILFANAHRLSAKYGL